MRDNLPRSGAGRQGLVLSKTGREDPRAVGFGLWFLHTAGTNGKPGRLLTDRHGITLDAVEAFLNTTEGQAPQLPL
jgi:hypothetical protein